MPNFKNPGGAEYRLQNEWTAYLEKAVRRARRNYLARMSLIASMEILTDFETMDAMASDEDELPDAYINLLYHDLKNALKQFPPQTRSIVCNKIIDDMTFSQIADHYGLPESTVKSIYYRALDKLRWLLV